jgi:putative ABC transport system ATP-binding protein
MDKTFPTLLAINGPSCGTRRLALSLRASIFPRLDGLRNVELPLVYGHVSTVERHKAAQEALKLVGLGDRADHLPAQLSGGQQQRAAIARALVNKPDIILADEPTGNLDSRTSAKLIDVFEKLNRDHCINLVLVIHDPDIGGVTHRIILIRDGRSEGDVRKNM